MGGFVFAFIQACSGQSGWGFVPHSAFAAEFAAAAPPEAEAFGAALPVAAALAPPDAVADGVAVANVPALSAAEGAADAVVAALADALGVAVEVDAVDVDEPEEVPSVFVHAAAAPTARAAARTAVRTCGRCMGEHSTMKPSSENAYSRADGTDAGGAPRGEA
jgi:hypothetical protein